MTDKEKIILERDSEHIAGEIVMAELMQELSNKEPVANCCNIKGV